MKSIVLENHISGKAVEFGSGFGAYGFLPSGADASLVKCVIHRGAASEADWKVDIQTKFPELALQMNTVISKNYDDFAAYVLAADQKYFLFTMFDHLVNHGAYSEADAARLVREVACALDFLHGIGVVHNDVNPENLMLSTQRTGDGLSL